MHAPLPAKMTWRSREVESRITESQVVVRWVQLETDIEVGFFAKLAAAPAVMAVGDNPKGVKLKDRVSPEAYEQWERLKQKYIFRRGNSVEKLRPAFAASELRSQAMSKTGLSSPKPGAVVWPVVQRLAKKHKVRDSGAGSQDVHSDRQAARGNWAIPRSAAGRRRVLREIARATRRGSRSDEDARQRLGER